MLCYHALNAFFNRNSSAMLTRPYIHLTDLALIIRRSLSNNASIIPSNLDVLLVSIIINITQECKNELRRNEEIPEVTILFLGTLYQCLHALVLRCMFLIMMFSMMMMMMIG